jgi:hypothetical protein
MDVNIDESCSWATRSCLHVAVSYIQPGGEITPELHNERAVDVVEHYGVLAYSN